MALDTELMIDRRLLKRRIFFWRLTAFLVFLLGLVVLAVANMNFRPTGDHIARIWIEGIILDDISTQDLLHEIRDEENVKAVIVRINSSGGSTAGSEALYEAMRSLGEKKPVVAVLGTVAASGGYIAAIGTDYIVARGNTLTGSIGILFQWFQLEGLLDKVGVESRSVKSDPLKASPNPFETPSPESLKVTRTLIKASYDWFVSLVAERRDMAPEAARKLGDGRVYTGFQAVENGLIDAIGGEQVAQSWLEKEGNIAPDLPVKTWDSVADPLERNNFVTRWIGGAFVYAFEEIQKRTYAGNGLMLDGLMSLWHPDDRQ